MYIIESPPPPSFVELILKYLSYAQHDRLILNLGLIRKNPTANTKKITFNFSTSITKDVFYFKIYE